MGKLYINNYLYSLLHFRCKVRLCLLFVFLIGFYNISDGQPTPASAWEYSRVITLSSPTSLADYQVKVSLSPVMYGGMNADGSDLRFYDNTNTVCNYWIEKWNTSGTSIIWVKVPTNGATALTMYYGNPAASPLSNGNATFDFFDDFLGTSLSSNWATNTSGGTIAVSGGEVNLYNTGNRVAIASPFTTASTSFVLEVKHKETNYYRNRFYATDKVVDLNADENSPTNWNDYGYFGGTRGSLTGYCYPEANAVSSNTNYITSWNITDGSAYTWSTFDYATDNLVFTKSQDVAADVRNVVIAVTESSNSTTSVDWIRVRKSTDATDITASIGEAVQLAPAISGFSPTAFCAGSNTVVTITGSNLSNAGAVSINGIGAASFTVDSHTQITAITSAATTTGKISVTTPGGTAISANDININPLPIQYNVGGGGSYCAGGSGLAITLSGSQSTVNYQLSMNGSPVGSAIPGNGGLLTFPLQTATGSYTIAAQNNSTVCARNMTGNTTIVINTVNKYDVTGTGNYCSGGPGLAVGLSKSDAGVNYQLLRGGSPVGSPVPGTGSAISFGNHTTGTYTVTATNTSTSCFETMNGSAAVGLFTPPSGTLSESDNSGTSPNDNKICLGENITFTATGGYQNYNFKIDGVSKQNGSSASFINPALALGTRSVTVEVTSSDGCTVTFNSVSVLVSNLPTATLSVSSNNICPATSVTFTAGGGDYFTFYIQGVQKYTGPSNKYTTSSLNNNDVVTVAVKNTSTGCTSISSGITMTVKPLPAAAGSISGNATVCQEQSGVGYSVPAIANATSYTWTLPVGATIASGTGTRSITVNYSNTAVTGNITVAGTNSCGNGVSKSLYVTVNPLPVDAGNIAGSSTVCQGQTAVAYTVPAITHATGYTWAVPTGATIASGANTNSITVNFSNAAISGNVKVLGTNDCGNGISSSIPVTVNPLPGAAGNITGTTTLCQGSIGAAYHVAAIASATDYTWTYTGSGITINNETTKDITIDFSNAATSGILTVIGNNNCGVGTVSANYTIKVNPLPTADITLDANSEICKNSTIKPGVIFTGASGTAPYTFTYNIDGGADKTITTTSGNSVTLSAPTNVPGTFTYNLISVKDALSTHCSNSQPGSVAIIVNTLPVPVLTGPNTICPDQTLDYSTQTGNGIKDYIWTITNGTKISGGTSTDNTVQVHWGNNSNPKSIYVNYTDGNGCSGNTSVSVISTSPQAPVITSSDASVCLNSSGAYSTQVGNPPYTDYLWEVSPGGEITSVNGTNTVTVKWNTSGPQYVKVNFNSGTCSAPAPTSYPVTVNPLPTATVATNNASVCQNSTSAPVITFTGANGVAPYTFSYSINGTVQADVVSSGNSKTITVPTSTAGDYIYKLIRVKGNSTCAQAQTDEVKVTVNTLPTASIGGATVVCKNSPKPDITFTGSNGTAPYTFTYKINGGANQTVTTTLGNSIIVSAATDIAGDFTYSITSVSDANGCTQTVTGQNVIVTVKNLPTATITGTDSVCLNNSANVTITGANGTAPYTFTYNINGGANLTAVSSGNDAVIDVTTSVAGPLQFNLVNVQEGSGNVCIQNQSGSWTVEVSPATAGGTINGSTSVCKGGGGSLTLNGQIGKITGWQSSTDGSNWNDINNTTSTLNYTGLLTTTQYRAVVKSGFCGIEYSGVAIITVNEAVGGTVTGSTTVCAGSSGSVQLTGNTGSVKYWQSSIDNGNNWVITSYTSSTLPYTSISQATWYRAVSQNSPCTIIYSDIAKVNVNARPNATISGNAAICDGGSATLTLNVTGAAPFSGTLSDGITSFSRSVSGTFTVTVSPNSSTAYTVETLTDANCSDDYSDKSGISTIQVNPVPVPPIIKPGNTTICEGGILPLTSVLNDVTNGTINTKHTVNKPIPDNDVVTGASDAIAVSGIPVGAIIDSVSVNFNITHPEVYDIKINLKAPNGKIITLVSDVDGENLTNTTISSNIGVHPVVKSGSAPYTGVFQADGEGTFAAQFGDANTRSFAALFGTTATPPNGNWVITSYDAGEEDEGTFNDWTLNVYYHVPIQPVEIVWSPMTGLYTDPSATIPYAGDPVAIVYSKPTTTTTYTGTATSSETCTSSSDITVTVKPAPVVTVKADYCAVPGFVQLTATSVPAATSYNWSTGGTTNTTLVDEAKLYVVSAQVDGCAGTGVMSVAQELVKNGDFEAGYIPGGFATEYGYVADDPAIQNELVQEGLFAIDSNAHNFHFNFFGKDHTTSAQTGKFMIINGYPNATTKIIWQQTVTVLPNTNYYYSAWAMNLNDAGDASSFAKLQFEVNGVPIGTIADLNIAPKPTGTSQVNIDNWVRFYYGNTTGWNSGSNTTAVIRIIDLNPALGGNDFGLDDISFATLSTFITRTSSLASDRQSVCKGSPIDNITYTVGSGGDGPLVTGLPRGVTSSFNGITFTISGVPDTVGVFTYTIVTQGSCNPATTTGTITATGQTISKPLDAGTDAQTICISTPAVPIKYNYGGTATDASVEGLPDGMTFTKNISTKLITIYGAPSQAGLFTYSVFTTQGACGHDTITGTINVTIQTINKTPESDTAQVICKGSAITPILYEIKGTGTGATVSGLPAGVTGSYNSVTGIYRISGTPTVTSGLYSYTVTSTGSCAAAAVKGTIEITPDATIHLTSAPGTDNQKLCFNSGSIALISYQVGVATGATVDGLPDGLTDTYSNGIFKITGTPTETGVFTYTVQTTGPCGQTSITGNITIDPEVSGGDLTYSYTATCSPASGTITLSGETGTIMGWESSTNGTNWSSISNTSHSQDFTVNNTTYFRAKIDGGACGLSLSNAVLIGVHNLWTGATSSDWNDGTNWSDGNVPSVSCPKVIIPGGTPHQPSLGSGKATINNLEIKYGAVLTIINNANLQVAGEITNSGALYAKEGTIEFNGSSAQSIAGSTFNNNALNNLVISNSSAAGVTISSTLDVYQSVSFGANGRKLTTGGYLTLKSTATETAWLGNMTGKTLEGDVTVERYINVGEGGNYHGKSWQFVATPTEGQTVWQSWMENGSKVSTGYGTQIPGQGGIPKGFDLYSATPSLKYYDYNSANWIGIDNTGVPVFNKQGYMIFIRGDRSVKFPHVGPTTLRTKGQLFTPAHPPVSTTVMADRSESVGNPYASSIDLSRLVITGGVAKIYMAWDPLLSGAYGLGAFQTLAQTQLIQGDNNFYATPGGGSYGSGANNFIQSGQAFFAQATGSNGTVGFNETTKAGGSKMVLRGGIPVDNPGIFAQIKAGLYGINADESTFLTDGNLVQYNSQYTNKIDVLDARKLGNSAENFGILSQGTTLAIERRKAVNEMDTINYQLTGLRNQSYRMEITMEGLSSYGYQGYIEDTYLNTSTQLTDGINNINFTVTSVAGSKSSNRFRIVFKAFAPLPVTFVSINAQQKNADVIVDWKVANEKNMLQYDIEKSSDGVRFAKSATVVATNNGQGSYQWTDQKVPEGYTYYRIKSISRDGKVEYSTVIKVLVNNGKSFINIYPNPITDGIIHLQLGNQPQGRYFIRLLNPLGQVIVARQASHAGGNGTQNIKWDYNLAHGVYQLEVTKPNGEVVVIKVMY